MGYGKCVVRFDGLKRSLEFKKTVAEIFHRILQTRISI